MTESVNLGFYMFLLILNFLYIHLMPCFQKNQFLKINFFIFSYLIIIKKISKKKINSSKQKITFITEKYFPFNKKKKNIFLSLHKTQYLLKSLSLSFFFRKQLKQEQLKHISEQLKYIPFISCNFFPQISLYYFLYVFIFFV